MAPIPPAGYTVFAPRGTDYFMASTPDGQVIAGGPYDHCVAACEHHRENSKPVRTADDERRDVLAFLRRLADDTGGLVAAALRNLARDIERGDHEGAADR